MKIQNINRADIGLHGLQASEGHELPADKALVFKQTLTELSKEQHMARLNELVKQIDEQGAKLSKKADIKEFERYRRLIRDFIDDVVSNGYEFSKENSFASRGRHRFMATVKTIDEKLDRLAKEVLSEQADSIKILHEIDDIRGLIVDMML